MLQLDVVYNCNFIETSELISDWNNADIDVLEMYFNDIDWDIMCNRNTEQAK